MKRSFMCLYTAKNYSLAGGLLHSAVGGRRLLFLALVHRVWGLAPSWVQDEAPSKGQGPSPLQEGSKDPRQSPPETKAFAQM